MSSTTFTIMVTLSILMLSLPRKFAILPLLLGTCYISFNPRFIVGGADFTVTRIIVLFGVIRMLGRSEHSSIKPTRLDKCLVLWVICSVVTGTILTQSVSGFVNRAGRAFDAFGFYFLIRAFISNEEDLNAVFKFVVFLFIPLSILMIVEKMTGRNPFGFFGGVNLFSAIRNGEVRASGPFAHAILAGTAGAAVLPYMIALWGERKKLFASIGITAAIAVVISSASSGPIMSSVFAIVAMLCWYCQDKIPQIRTAIFITLIILEISMKSHVWYLIGRIDLTGSSTGYHRAQLITSALNHIEEWWLVGTNYTRHWMPTGVSWSPDHTDITNHFILIGVNGGLPSMIMFICLFIIGYKLIGLALKSCTDNVTRLKIWAIGSVLFTHMVTFVSVAYFDQSVVFLYMAFALASSCASIFTSQVQYKGNKFHYAFNKLLNK